MNTTTAAVQSLTEELSRAAKEIQNASYRLSKEFEKTPDIPTSEGEREVPDPVKLIRRICALERVISLLTNDCIKIADARGQIAPLVIQIQQENVSLIQELSQSFPPAMLGDINKKYAEERGDQKENAEDQEVSELEEWSTLAEKLNEQAKFFVSSPPSANHAT